MSTLSEQYGSFNYTITGIGPTVTHHYTSALFRGKVIMLHTISDSRDPTPPCEIHQVEVMHHVGPDGRHYCPTGFVWCPTCGGGADEPRPNECKLWGELPLGGTE